MSSLHVKGEKVSRKGSRCGWNCRAAQRDPQAGEGEAAIRPVSGFQGFMA